MELGPNTPNTSPPAWLSGSRISRKLEPQSFGSRPSRPTGRRRPSRAAAARQFALAIVSMVMGIPITAITASEVDPSILGVAVSWAGIVGVNWVHARPLRKRK